ncbi:hypothetical protein H2200_002001 [Cladophialophora chaetospira]|uniref:Uncharacterized protein n=1 Tax=Cladophialophora chaetospira TaxID=386627 RepID=A0AA39CPL2_9EURO|nr:hypothetical protein H2200_002001 [Cladophialophora chaetospira]
MAPSLFEKIRSKINHYQAFHLCSQHFAATSRTLKIQLLWQTTKWSKSHESKKTAIYKSRVAALLHILLHLVPLSAGIALVVLNLKTTFIGSFPHDGFAGIQFASKLLEVLVQASITAAVLGWAGIRVQGAQEVPFGGLIAPLRITNVSSLWSLEFWGCFTSTKIAFSTKMALSTVLPAATILAAVVGPSSAVLMIPRPLTRPGFSQIFILNRSEYYPETVGLEDGRLQAEAACNKTAYQALLGAEWPQQLVDAFGIRGLKWATANADTYSIATVPAGELTTLVNVSTSDIAEYRALQPYIKVYCSRADWFNITNPDSQYVDFGPEQPDLQGTVSFTKLMPNYSKPADDDSFALLRVPGDPILDGPGSNNSLLWTRIPRASNRSLVMVVASIGYDDNVYYGSTAACTFDAYCAWVTSEKSLDLPLTSEFPKNENEDPLESLSRLKEKVSILLEPEWAKRALTNALEVTGGSEAKIWKNLSGYSTIYAPALSYVPRIDGSIGLGTIFQRGKNLLVSADADSTDEQYTAMLQYIDSSKLQQKYDEVSVLYNTADHTSVDWTDPPSLIHIEMRTFFNGYGYNSSPAAVRLSLIVMIIYITTTIAWLAYTMITGKVATSWDTVAELVTLALNSKTSPVLKNTSVGIDTVEVFRQPVNIRVNQEDSLEIVFDAARQGGKYTEVEPNKKY